MAVGHVVLYLPSYRHFPISVSCYYDRRQISSLDLGHFSFSAKQLSLITPDTTVLLDLTHCDSLYLCLAIFISLQLLTIVKGAMKKKDDDYDQKRNIKLVWPQFHRIFCCYKVLLRLLLLLLLLLLLVCTFQLGSNYYIINKYNYIALDSGGSLYKHLNSLREKEPPDDSLHNCNSVQYIEKRWKENLRSIL